MKRALALILAIIMVAGLVACGGTKTPTSSGTSAGTSTPAPSGSSSGTTEPSKPTEPEKPAEPKILHLPSATAAANACSLISTGAADMDIQGRITGKLYGYLPEDGKAVLSPILADGEPVDVNGDGITWNIKVHKDAKWENGDPINADTVVFSYKAALDPKLVLAKATSVAKNHATILNATEYYNQNQEGKSAVAWEDVGVKKIDEQTFQITLAAKSNKAKVMRQVAILPLLYQPLWEKCLSADGTTTTYGTAQDKIISAGPYKLTNWVIGSVREFAKNEYWVRADYIKLDGQVWHVVEDAGTKALMFENGELHATSLTTEAAEQYGDDPRLMTVPSRYIDVIDFCWTNTDKPILANENFRLALYYGMDRNTLAKLGGVTPATGYISPTATAYADGTTFRQLATAAGYEPANGGYDPEKAVAYFEKALQECNLTSVEVTLLAHSNTARHVITAEFLQEAWANVFGKDRFKLNLDMQPSKTALAQKKSWKTNTNAYELTISSWSLGAQDYDPVLALQVYTSVYGNRNGPYNFPELEAIWAKLEQPENLLDEKNRAEIAMEFEKALLAHAYAVPTVFNSTRELISDDVILAVDEYGLDLGWAYNYADLKQ